MSAEPQILLMSSPPVSPSDVVQVDFEDLFPSGVLTGQDALPPASCQGRGTEEILELTKKLEEVSITCCVVGTAALQYYGAPRVKFVRRPGS